MSLESKSWLLFYGPKFSTYFFVWILAYGRQIKGLTFKFFGVIFYAGVFGAVCSWNLSFVGCLFDGFGISIYRLRLNLLKFLLFRFNLMCHKIYLLNWDFLPQFRISNFSWISFWDLLGVVMFTYSHFKTWTILFGFSSLVFKLHCILLWGFIECFLGCLKRFEIALSWSLHLFWKRLSEVRESFNVFV